MTAKKTTAKKAKPTTSTPKTTTPTAARNAGSALIPTKAKTELNIVDGKIAYLKTITTTSGFRDSFTDGPTWRDTFADGGQWVSNFNNLGADKSGLRHPATQLALENIKQTLTSASGKAKK